MELELCDFELSVMLKEVGFDWITSKYYSTRDKSLGLCF